MAKTESVPTAKTIERKFKVIRGQVGPWNIAGANGKPNVFTESEFRRLNPIGPSGQADESINPETYHNDLIDRLLAMKVIAHAPDDEVTPTPLGPESNPGRPARNQAIADSVRDYMASRPQLPTGETVGGSKVEQHAAI